MRYSLLDPAWEVEQVEGVSFGSSSRDISRKPRALFVQLRILKMTSRPLEHLVLFTAVATGSQDEGEENLIVLLAWEIISISKNQVGFKWS